MVEEVVAISANVCYNFFSKNNMSTGIFLSGRIFYLPRTAQQVNRFARFFVFGL